MPLQILCDKNTPSYLFLTAGFLVLPGYMFWRIQSLHEERIRALKNVQNQHYILSENKKRFRIVYEATNQDLYDLEIPENKLYSSPVRKLQVSCKDDELENDFKNAPQYNFILLDMNMPKINDREVLKYALIIKSCFNKTKTKINAT